MIKYLLTAAILALVSPAHAAGPATTTAPTTLLNTPCAAGVVLVGGGVGLAPGCAGNATIPGTLGVGASASGQLGVYNASGWSTTANPYLYAHSHIYGTVTSGQAFANIIAVDADGLDPTTGSGPGGAVDLYVGHTITGGAKGGRTALEVLLNQTTATTLAQHDYYAALGATANVAYNVGGGAGTEKGNVAGANFQAVANSGATHYVVLNSLELDIALASGASALYKDGLKVVQNASDALHGSIGDFGIGVANQAAGTAPGWNVGFAFGAPEGWWPITSTGTMIGTYSATIGGGPSMAAALGIDFSAVTFSTGAFKSTGFLVDGSGNLTAASFTAGISAGVSCTGPPDEAFTTVNGIVTHC